MDPRRRPATALQAAPITDPLPLPHQQRILQTHCGDGLRDTPRSPAAFGRLNLAGCRRDQLTSRCAVETAFLYIPCLRGRPTSSGSVEIPCARPEAPISESESIIIRSPSINL